MVEYSEDLTEEQIAEINAQTVDAGDRALISVQPFSAETLTVTMKNGEVFTINIRREHGFLYQDSRKIHSGEPEAYEAYYEKALSDLQDKYDEKAVLSFARFYDIRFVYNGGEVEPAGEVKVRIEYKKAIEIPKETNVDAVHFDRNNGEEPEVIRSEVNSPETETTKKGEDKIVRTVDFESDRFSVYGIVGTVIEKTVLASDGRNYTVTVTYGADTGIPADADLSVEEITESSSLYDAYVAGTESVLGMEEGSAGYIRLFDIRIVDKDDVDVK